MKTYALVGENITTVHTELLCEDVGWIETFFALKFQKIFCLTLGDFLYLEPGLRSKWLRYELDGPGLVSQKGRRRSGVSIPERERDFYFVQSVQTDSGDRRSLLFDGYPVFPRG